MLLVSWVTPVRKKRRLCSSLAMVSIDRLSGSIEILPEVSI